MEDQNNIVQEDSEIVIQDQTLDLEAGVKSTTNNLKNIAKKLNIARIKNLTSLKEGSEIELNEENKNFAYSFSSSLIIPFTTAFLVQKLMKFKTHFLLDTFLLLAFFFTAMRLSNKDKSYLRPTYVLFSLLQGAILGLTNASFIDVFMIIQVFCGLFIFVVFYRSSNKNGEGMQPYTFRRNVLISTAISATLIGLMSLPHGFFLWMGMVFGIVYSIQVLNVLVTRLNKLNLEFNEEDGDIGAWGVDRMVACLPWTVISNSIKVLVG